MEQLERVKYQAALAVSGCWQGSNRNKLYKELGWESLSDRRWARRLITLFKIYRFNSPPYLYEYIPTQRIPIFGSRSSDVLHNISCRTSKFMNSFFPNVVRSWNNISDEERNSCSIEIFKKKLYSLIRPPKRETYGIHDPVGLKNIFRLSVGLSHLNFHKYKHNFLDTPSPLCACHLAQEDSFHFVLECSIFAEERLALQNLVQIILEKYDLLHCLQNLETYLYGHNEITELDNRNIILATIEFVSKTNRFQ